VTVSDHRELVSALLAVPGVAAAAVEPMGGEPGTLRLQLEHGADEMGVAGEVNHLLRNRFGLAVDAERLRIVDGSVAGAAGRRRRTGPDATMPDESPDATMPDESPTPTADSAGTALPEVTVTRPGRLVIGRVQLVSAGLATSVSVTLLLDGRAFEGTADGTVTAGSLHRSVAGATLRAAEAVVAGAVRFDVEHVEVTGTGAERTALVVVTMVTDRATQRLSGASVVHEDVRQAVIRAVLAAVNRRLEPMLAAQE